MGQVWSYDENDKIPGFAEIAPGIYRGGQPTEEGYAYLQTLGVKTVVNFRNETDWIESGRILARKHGMAYVTLPWTIYGDLEEKRINQFYSLIEDEENYPLFLYCKRGVERTGIMAYLYLRRYEELSHEEASRRAFEGFPLKWIWRPFVGQKLKGLKERFKRA